MYYRLQALTIALARSYPLRSGRPKLLCAWCGGSNISLTMSGRLFDSQLQGYCFLYHHEIIW